MSSGNGDEGEGVMRGLRSACVVNEFGGKRKIQKIHRQK
jgi:hypothetical protein